MSERAIEKYVNTLLAGEHLADFERVKRHHGIKTNADVVRFLIRKEARSLQGDGYDRPGVAAIVAGWLRHKLTDYEAMQALAAHPDLLPMLIEEGKDHDLVPAHR